MHVCRMPTREKPETAAVRVTLAKSLLLLIMDSGNYHKNCFLFILNWTLKSNEKMIIENEN